MSPKDVHVGRGRLAAERRVPYIEALRAGDAGKIELEAGDRPQVVKRVLAEAAKETGIKVRSSWEDSSQRVLLWKRTGK
jgi:hypothetical protein